MPSIIRVIDSHAELADMTAGDDHSQYVLLAGRAGGQTLYGGTAANDDISISGTSHATKTTSYVLLQPTGGYVGIGRSTPVERLDVLSNVQITEGHLLLRSYTAGAHRLVNIQNSRGTEAAPTYLLSGDEVGAIAFREGTSSGVGEGGAGISVFATENWNAGALGSKVLFFNTPTGSIVKTTYLTIDGSNNAGWGTDAPDSLMHLWKESANTNAVQQLLTLSVNSTGTAAAGFGSRILWELESSTTADQTAAALDMFWHDATHGNKDSGINLQLVYGGTLSRWLHNYRDATADGDNIFLGRVSGNTTLSPAGGASTLASYNVGVGSATLTALTTGYQNVAVGQGAASKTTTGYQNVAIGGYLTLYENLTGNNNAAVGYMAARNTTGSNNTAIGTQSFYSATGISGGVAVGFRAGYHETGSNKLFIDNDGRASEADGRAKALIYGVFDAATANQTLALNAVVTVLEGLKVTNGSAKIGGTAARSGTAGTNRLDIFDGTAPVGTLANGVSLYSVAGKLWAMDAAGNATQLTP